MDFATAHKPLPDERQLANALVIEQGGDLVGVFGCKCAAKAVQ